MKRKFAVKGVAGSTPIASSRLSLLNGETPLPSRPSAKVLSMTRAPPSTVLKTRTMSRENIPPPQSLTRRSERMMA